MRFNTNIPLEFLGTPFRQSGFLPLSQCKEASDQCFRINSMISENPQSAPPSSRKQYR